jgi:hypothetical protein
VFAFSLSATVRNKTAFSQIRPLRRLIYGVTGARQLMTYRRLPEGEVSDISQGRTKVDNSGVTASEVNEFRRKVFMHLFLSHGQAAYSCTVFQQIPNQGNRGLVEKKQSILKNSSCQIPRSKGSWPTRLSVHHGP